jgi:hypothetical protein
LTISGGTSQQENKDYIFPMSVPTEAIPITPQLSPVQEIWDTLTILDGKMDIRYRDLITFSNGLPLNLGDNNAQQMLDSQSNWIGDLIRQLEVTPMLGDANLTMLVTKMVERAKKIQHFISVLQPHVGVSAQVATDIVIDTSMLHITDSSSGQYLIKT